MAIDPQQLYFYDPRLQMTPMGRFLVRVGAVVGLVVLLTLAFFFTFVSDVRKPGLQYLGILLFIFLIDIVFHARNARREIDQAARKRLSHGARMNIADYLMPRAFSAVIWAAERSRLTKKSFPLTLLVRLATLKEIETGLMRMDVNAEEFRARVAEQLKKSTETPPAAKLDLLDQIEAFMRYAFIDGAASGDVYVEPRDLFSALFHLHSDDLASIFSFFGLEEIDLENALLFGKYRKQIAGFKLSYGDFAARDIRRRTRVMNRAWTAKPTKTLDRYSTDLTGMARSGRAGFMVGHGEELKQLTDILSRPLKGSAVLVGEAGSGKGVIVNHLAFLISRDHVPPALFDKRLIELSIGNLVAGANPSELQGRMKKILDEIIAAKNVILFIPDLHNMFKTSGDAVMNAADILLPYVQKGAFQIIGATTLREYKRVIEPAGNFGSAFEAIHVKEVSDEEAERYLVYSAIVLEGVYKITISYKAVKRAVALAKRYQREKMLPASAEDLLKETLADAKERKSKSLREDDVVAIMERKVDVPIHRATQDEAKKLLNIEDEIHKRFIDQEDAVSVVARALREYRSGLTRQGGPIATFLFVGPTGVGKTELSKTLAAIQFGSESAMVRFDMSEFQERNSIERLLGSPDGRVTGQLTEAVRLKPFCLLLLDEFEKAHPDLLNLFLQVFDDGRLTDGTGLVVDFTNTIIIATSNAHSDFIKSEIEHGRAPAGIAEDLKRMLVSYFKPELLNRFSDIVVFRSLAMEHIMQIARLNLNELGAILQNAHGITLSADDSAVKALAEAGFDPAYGARPLRKVISDRLKAKLANALLQGEVGRGEHVRLVYENNDFHFVKEQISEQQNAR